MSLACSLSNVKFVEGLSDIKMMGGRIVEDWKTGRLEVGVKRSTGQHPPSSFTQWKETGPSFGCTCPTMYKVDFLNHDSGRSPGEGRRGDLPEQHQMKIGSRTPYYLMEMHFTFLFSPKIIKQTFFLFFPLLSPESPPKVSVYGTIYPRIQAFSLFASSSSVFHNHVFISFFPFSRSLALCPLRSPRGVVRRRWMNPIRLDSTVIDSDKH